MVTKLWAILLTVLTYVFLTDYAVAKEQDVLSTHVVAIGYDQHSIPQNYPVIQWDDASSIIDVPRLVSDLIKPQPKSFESAVFNHQVEQYKQLASGQ